MADTTPCSADDCARAPFCRGMCRRHYRAAMNHDAPTVATCETCGVEYRRNRKAQTNYCPPCSDRSPAKIAANQARAATRRRNWPKSSVHFLTCAGCGTLFTTGRARKYCAAECYPKKVWPIKPCAKCGSPKELLDTYCADCKRENLRRAREAWRAKRPGGQESHRRRARRFGVKYEPIVKTKIYERDGWRCGICYEAIDADRKWPDPMSASLDHIVPLSKGGDHVPGNVQASHLTCNVQKGATLPGRGVCASTSS